MKDWRAMVDTLGDVLGDALGDVLGEGLRRARLGTRQRQADVAAAAGISQSLVSRMECGLGGQVPMSTWQAVAAAVDTDFTAQLSLRAPRDASSDDPRIRMADLVARLAAGGGWVADRMIVANVDGTVRDIDLTLRHAERQSVAVVRVWDVVPSTHAVIDDLDRAIARAATDNPSAAIGGLVIIRPSMSNRRRITEGGRTFDRRFIDSGSRWIGTLTRATRQRLPPDAMLWVDPTISRLIPTRLYLQRPRNRKAPRPGW